MAPLPDVRVFATDIDSAAIAFARRGLYPPAALQNVPAACGRATSRKSDGGFEVVKSLRSLMIFGEHDLGARSPFPRIDLILCRNVLIYFNQAMQRAALETFGFSLRDDGRLVLGPSETVAALPAIYVQDHARMRIYRRAPGPRPLPLPKIDDGPPAPGHRGAPRDGHPVDAPGCPAGRGFDRGGRGAPAQPEPRRRRGRCALLHHAASIRPRGACSGSTAWPSTRTSFTSPSRSRPPSVRTAIDAALGGKTTTTVHEIEATDVSAKGSRFIETVIRPYARPAGNVVGAVIELSDVSAAERDRVATSRAGRRLERATVVNRRLLAANEELTALIAEIRLANQAMLQSSEEAQSGREEVETLNEEFQATNEELETLNEELTASVEELRVANEDLVSRTEELRLQTVALEDQKQHGEEEHNRLESVLASLGDAVVAVDHAGRTLATNRAYDRLFGGPDAEIRPEDLAGLPLPEEEWPQHRAARGERFRMEFAISDSDGSRRWFEAVTEPLTSQDRQWGGVVAIRDVSERTMRLSLERLMAAAGHELKTPTAAIHNYLQLVDRHLAAGEVKQAGTYAGRALSQTRRLATLIERLLDVSRIQTGQLELLLEVVDLAAVVRTAVEVAQVLPKAPPIQLTAGPRPVRVRADPGRLEQVFLNLLANAIDHAPDSGPIEVTVETSDGSGRRHRPRPRRRHRRQGHPDHVRCLHAARPSASSTGARPWPVRGARDRGGPRRRDRGSIEPRRRDGADRPASPRKTAACAGMNRAGTSSSRPPGPAMRHWAPSLGSIRWGDWG